MPRRRVLALSYPTSILAALALPLGACGDDTTGGPVETITDTATSTSTSTTGLTTSSTTDPSSSTTDPSTTTDPGTATDPSTTTDGTTTGETSGSTGVASFCGDGTLDDGEICDDGNIYDGDGCSADCQTASCLVPLTHATIQDGVDDVGCTTVFVEGGMYTENLVIDRSVTIEGIPTAEVTIDGDGGDTVVTIVAGVVTLRNVTVTNGFANQGGGIYNEGPSLTLDHSTVTLNQATGLNLAGGGIYSLGSVTLLSSEVSENSLSGKPISAIALGAGIYIEGGTLTVAGGSLIDSNQLSLSGLDSPVGLGGGIYADGSAVVITGGSVLSNNMVMVNGTGNFSAFGEGGGIVADFSQVSIGNATISGNTVTVGQSGSSSFASGGGLSGFGTELNLGPGTIVDNNSAIANGANVLARGGGAYVPQSSLLITTGGVFTNNTADADADGANARARGGAAAIEVFSASAFFAGCTLDTNTATADFANAGTAEATGGGISIETGGDDGSVVVAGCTASNNSAESNDFASGGGMFARSTFLVVGLDIVNSTISGNSVTGTNSDAGGGIAAVADNGFTEVRIASSTVANNSGGAQGGGLWDLAIGEASAVFRLQNSILYDNMATTGTDCAASVDSGDYNVIGVATDCFFFGSTANDQIGADPGLGTLGDNGGPTQTMEIGVGMSAENAGNPGGCFAHNNQLLDNDQRGLPRVGDCDVGAYEIQ